MSEGSPTSPPGGLPADPVIASAAGWSDAVRWAFDGALTTRARRIWCYDADYADWPLDDTKLIDTLARWLRLPQRRLTLLAERWDTAPRRHPRFASWRRDWSHAIDTLAVPTDLLPSWPAAWVDDQRTVLRLLDRLHWRGLVSRDASAAALLRQEIDALAQRSAPDFPVTSLGL
jgi:hypothetical protein